MSTTAEREAAVYMMSAGRQPVVLVRGEGSKLWDDGDKAYLDFVSGIASDSLGHSHPKVVETIQRQAETLIQVSNYYYTLPQLDLGEILLRESGMQRLFFVNSGAEATEGAIKLARKWGRTHRGGHEIIAMENSFHGRTLASISATGTARYSEPFGPVDGFTHVPFNDVDAVRSAVTEATAAILVEPIQGEGGVNVPADGYLAALREICDAHDLLLMLDEVQTGIGRTGRLFAWQHEGVQPDVMALAKGLGSGVPIGAFLANERADILEPGDHGTTFGGQPFTAAVAHTVLSTILDEEIPEQVAQKGELLMGLLRSLQDRHPAINEVRGKGLLVAIEFSSEIGAELVVACRERGMLCNTVRADTLRLIPPLVITEDELQQAVDIIDDALTSIAES